MIEPGKIYFYDDRIFEIGIDEYSDNPRTHFSNLSHMLSFDNDVVLDEHDIDTDDINGNVEKYIRERYKDILYMLPINAYKHSGISLYLGDVDNHFDAEWDCGCIGVLYVTLDDWKKEFGDIEFDKPRFEKIIDDELNIVNDYLNNNVYSYTEYNLDGEIVDSCCGFYGDDGLEQIENDYIGGTPTECKEKSIDKVIITLLKNKLNEYQILY